MAMRPIFYNVVQGNGPLKPGDERDVLRTDGSTGPRLLGIVRCTMGGFYRASRLERGSFVSIGPFYSEGAAESWIRVGGSYFARPGPSL